MRIESLADKIKDSLGEIIKEFELIEYDRRELCKLVNQMEGRIADLEAEIENLKDKIKKQEEEAIISSQFGLPFFVVPRNYP